MSEHHRPCLWGVLPFGRDIPGMLFAKLEVCHLGVFASLNVTIGCTEYIGIYFEIVLDNLGRV